MTSKLPVAPMTDFLARAKKNRNPVARVDGAFLKFNGKTGRWELGQECTDVTGDEIIVHPASLSHGFIRWGSNPPVKVFTSIADAEPARPESVDGEDLDGRATTFHAQAARQFMGVFVDGAQEQFSFSTNSMGGVERSEGLYDAVMARAEIDPASCFPVVKLEADFYTRATGKVYKPVFTIVEWTDEKGVDAPEPEKIEPPKEEKKTRRRRRVA